MSTRSLRAALEEADQAIERHGLSVEVDQRLLRRLKQPQASARSVKRWHMAVAALAATCAILVLLRPAQNTARRLGGLTLVHATPDLDPIIESDQSVALQRGACTLIDEAWGATYTLSGPARVRREDGGVRVVRGTVKVSVEKRRPQAVPARIFVSHGTIQVMGTRFTIEQGVDSGRVTLHEGAILFRSPGADDVVLRPGESLAWPSSAPSPPPAAESIVPVALPRRPVAHVSRPSRPEVDPGAGVQPPGSEASLVAELLEEISVLRSRGLYEESVSSLSKALSHKLGSSTRERLSFELGSILTYQVGDSKRACAHWNEHRQQYREGRYDAEIDQATEHLKCSPTN